MWGTWGSGAKGGLPLSSRDSGLSGGGIAGGLQEPVLAGHTLSPSTGTWCSWLSHPLSNFDTKSACGGCWVQFPVCPDFYFVPFRTTQLPPHGQGTEQTVIILVRSRRWLSRIVMASMMSCRSRRLATTGHTPRFSRLVFRSTMTYTRASRPLLRRHPTGILG